MPDEGKFSLLLRKLGTVECESLIGFIHPRTISDLSFEESALILLELFSEKSSNSKNALMSYSLQKA